MDKRKQIHSIIQGLYGISESEKMMPKEAARFTLSKTVECLKTALEQYEEEIRKQTITEIEAELKEKAFYSSIYDDSCQWIVKLEDVDKIAKEMKNSENMELDDNDIELNL